MAAMPRYLSSSARSLACPLQQAARPNFSIPSFLNPAQQQQFRAASVQANKAKSAKAGAKSKTKSKNKKSKEYKEYDLRKAIQFSLCDAMRYIRAFEVGKDLKSVKYELHVKLRTKRDGPVIRNQLTLPHAVQSAARVCVICPPGSRAENAAKAAKAEIVGEEDIFESIKAGKIDFEVCIAHPSSVEKMNKAGIGRVLGPRGLMPSAKMGTVVDNVGAAVRNTRTGSFYREREGVVRMAIGQLGFSPDELRANVRTFISQVKKDAAALEQVTKSVSEVVLSSTNSPGFSLNGDFRSEHSIPTPLLTGP